jgi:hypothetical protein
MVKRAKKFWRGWNSSQALRNAVSAPTGHVRSHLRRKLGQSRTEGYQFRFTARRAPSLRRRWPEKGATNGRRNQ